MFLGLAAALLAALVWIDLAVDQRHVLGLVVRRLIAHGLNTPNVRGRTA